MHFKSSAHWNARILGRFVHFIAHKEILEKAFLSFSGRTLES